MNLQPSNYTQILTEVCQVVLAIFLCIYIFIETLESDSLYIYYIYIYMSLVQYYVVYIFYTSSNNLVTLPSIGCPRADSDVTINTSKTTSRATLLAIVYYINWFSLLHLHEFVYICSTVKPNHAYIGKAIYSNFTSNIELLPLHTYSFQSLHVLT